MSLKTWAEFRAPDFGAVDPLRTVAILPVAAVEQHGPHLPVGTDLHIMEGMLARLRAACPDDLDLRVLPIQAVGKSNEHLWAKGTLTLTAETALRVWTELGLSVARAGVRKIAIVNSHGGNVDINSIVARELRIAAGMLAVKTSWFDHGLPEGAFSERERRFGIHGGDAETSLMLAFRPELVDMAQAADFASAAETAPIPPVGPTALAWIASDLNPAGVVGEAHLATAAKGEATAAHQVSGMLRLLGALAALPLPEA